MALKPSEKLNSHCKFYLKVQNKIYGDGYNEGDSFPKNLKILISFLLTMLVMYFNGLYENRKDYIKIFPLIAVLSMIFQLISGPASRIAGKDKELTKAHEIVEKFYKNEEKNPDYIAILNKVFDKAILTLKYFVIISFIFYHTPVNTSVVLSIWKQEYILAFNIHFPFTDPHTLFGYLLNFAVISVAPTLFWIMIENRTTHAIFYTVQYIAMVEIFTKKLEKFAKRLNEFLKKKIPTKLPGPSTSKISDIVLMKIAEERRKKELKTIENQLIELIKEYGQFNEYKASILTYMENMVFVAMSSNSVAIGLSLLYARLGSFAIGLSLVAVNFFQVFVPCVIGTVVSTQNRKLVEAINSFPWYELTPNMKKVYLQFVHQCQNTNGIELPIIGELNMELFTNVMNASYSYVTYLLNFVK